MGNTNIPEWFVTRECLRHPEMQVEPAENGVSLSLQSGGLVTLICAKCIYMILHVCIILKDAFG